MIAPTDTGWESLAVGQPAPDLTLSDTSGTGRSLADLWQSAPAALLLVLLRHYG